MHLKRSHLRIFLPSLLLGAFLIVCAGASQAATYWVSPTGTAAWANCSGATPLNGTAACSATTAMANAAADDIVNFRGGTYNVGPDPGDGYVGALNPAHSGTSGHNIVFQAYPGETPVIQCDWNNNTYYQCRALGTGGGAVEYITYDGFTVQSSDGVHGASISLGGSSSPPTNGFVVTHNIVKGGDSAPNTFDDNYDGIRLTWASNVTVKNNIVYGFRRSDRGGSNDNFACIKVYGTSTITIENNEIYNCNSGISVKRPSDHVNIGYNYIHTGVYEGIRFNINTGVSFGSVAWNIYHNVINITAAAGAGGGAITGASDNGSYFNDSFTFYNNTIRNVNDDVLYCGLCANLKWYNNIGIGVQRSDYGFFNTVRNVSTILEEDYNEWGTASFHIQVRRYETFADYTSLVSWLASTELLGGGHPGTGDLISDPLFVNGSGNYSQLTDFNLLAGSPAKGTGKGGLNMGADIAAVGPAGMKISPPSNLRVQ